MRLLLKLEAPWREAAPGDGEATVFARGDVPARLFTTALYDRFAPTRPAASHELPGEITVEIIAETDGRSALGWPVHVVERIVTSTGAARRELEVRYAFFELGGAVVVTGPADSIARHRDELLAAALTGRPDWSGEVACIADLLSGVI